MFVFNLRNIASTLCFFLLFGCFGGSATKTIRINSKASPKAHFHKPLKKVVVLSRFGKRGKSFHTGLDIRGRRGGGDKVLASRSGRVTFVGKQSGYGKMITLKHADGYKTRYAHLKKYYVKKGQRVKAKQSIGVVGRSGRASTEHLHFEVITPSGRFANPAKFIFRR